MNHGNYYEDEDGDDRKSSCSHTRTSFISQHRNPFPVGINAIPPGGPSNFGIRGGTAHGVPAQGGIGGIMAQMMGAGFGGMGMGMGMGHRFGRADPR